MFKRKKQNLNSFSKLERTEEYKNVPTMALVFAVRYCNKHKKELSNKEDVKKCFDKALELYKTRKNNKLEELNNA